MTVMRPTGSCRCGAVQYELAVGDVPPVYCCHCLDCQRWSGSAFSEQAVILEGTISATGPLIETIVTSRQGAVSLQFVCGACHSRIYSKNPKRPGIMLLRAGTLDQAPSIQPRAHIWVKRMQSWLVLPSGTAAFQEGASPEEFRGALK